jgi:Ca2+-binding RTX toxin-like protein
MLVRLPLLLVTAALLCSAAPARAATTIDYRDPSGAASFQTGGTIDIEGTGPTGAAITAGIYAGNPITLNGLTCDPVSAAKQCDTFSAPGGTVTHDPCRILNLQIVCPDAGTFVANLGPGDDSLLFNGPLGYYSATLHGGAGNDRLSASIATGISNATTIFGDAGDDRLVGGSGPADLHGGDGNDTLLGGSGGARMLGEAGSDRLFGGPGNDTEDGGDGTDALGGDPDGFDTDGGADILNGGPGTDSVDYYEWGGGVSVSLDGAADDGSPGEGDNVGSDIEQIVGSPGNDTLTGGPGPDVINGEQGNDVISGGAGNDTLTGEAGDDRISGGPGSDTVVADTSSCGLLAGCPAGNDVVDVADGELDSVNCGPGADRVTADVVDALASDPLGNCEQVTRVAPPPPPPPPPPPNAFSARIVGATGNLREGLVVKLSCSAACKLAASATISAKDARKAHLRVAKRAKTVRIASATARLARAGTAAAHLHPAAKTTRRLKRLKRVAVNVTMTATDATGARATATKTLTIR